MERSESGSRTTKEPKQLLSSICKQHTLASQNEQLPRRQLQCNRKPSRDWSVYQRYTSCPSVAKYRPYDSKLAMLYHNGRSEISLGTSTIDILPLQAARKQSRGFKGAQSGETNYITTVNKRKKLSKRFFMNDQQPSSNTTQKTSAAPLLDQIALTSHHVFAEDCVNSFWERKRSDHALSLPALVGALCKPVDSPRHSRSLPDRRQQQSQGRFSNAGPHRQPKYVVPSMLCTEENQVGDFKDTSKHPSDRCRDERTSHSENLPSGSSEGITCMLNQIKAEKDPVKMFGNRIPLPGFFAPKTLRVHQTQLQRSIFHQKKIPLPALVQNVFQSCVKPFHYVQDRSPMRAALYSACRTGDPDSVPHFISEATSSYITDHEIHESGEMPVGSSGASKSKLFQSKKSAKTSRSNNSCPQLQQTKSAPTPKHFPAIQFLNRSTKRDEGYQSPSSGRSIKTSTSIESDTSKEEEKSRSSGQCSLPVIQNKMKFVQKRRDSLNLDADDEASATNFLNNEANNSNLSPVSLHDHFHDQDITSRKIVNTKKKKKHKVREKELPSDSVSSSNVLDDPGVRKKPRKKKKSGVTVNATTRKNSSGEVTEKRSSLGSDGDDEREEGDEDDHTML